jgi:hypothetical protein
MNLNMNANVNAKLRLTLKRYSVVGLLETVRLLETLIGKLLQNLLNLLVIIFRSIYIYARDADQKWCQLRKYLYRRNFEKV